MDFVYICRNGDNQELKYSIRSVFANTKVNSLWVVGGKPDWYVGNYIEVSQNLNKYTNAANNLKAIIHNEEIPDSFILMNDDFYITRPIDSIPVYHGGLLSEKIERYRKVRMMSRYTEILSDTDKLLKENGVPHPLDYSLHVPMKMHKQNLDFSIRMGGAIRSVYGNMNRLGGIRLPVEDVKVYEKSEMYPNSFDYMNNKYDLPFLSSTDKTFHQVFRKALQKFNEKSPAEIGKQKV
jgi:hypothetical protein